MLSKLSIENYALIEQLNIDLPNGLVIITGETGAGKSILLGALSLLLGAKADSDVVLNKNSNCIVEAVFTVPNDSIVIDILNNDDIELLDNNTIILRRVISPLGRSRVFINDSPVNIATLTSISSKLVDIHAQHQHLLLADQAYQLNILDLFSNSGSIINEYKEINNNLSIAKSELNILNKQIEKDNNELDYKQFQLEKLIEAKLIDGELEELELEQKELANSEEIKKYAYESLELLNNNDGSILQNIKQLASLMNKCAQFVPKYSYLAERVESCRIEIKDIESELSSLADDIIVSPQRLEVVDERLSMLYSLLKKYNKQYISELIEIRDILESELNGASISVEKRDLLAKKVNQLTQQREDIAIKLYENRVSYSKKLSDTLQERIKELEMPHAKLEIEVNHTNNYTNNGADTIEYKFSANGSNNLVSIQKVASGGELSRIMLSIKSLMAEYTKMPTMIFDEIDTGVSGKIADKMGKLIGDMGNNMQIFAITHLPQIAAKGKTHLLVEKTFNNQTAKTNLRNLEAEERVLEIARMLSGSELSQAAIDNAKFLLKN